MNPIGNESMRTLFIQFMRNRTLINEITLQDTDLALMGVTVQSVQGHYVVLTDQGSPGMTTYVALDKIVAIEV